MAEVNSTDSLYIALGLKPDDSYETAVLAASEKSDAVLKILEITKADSLPEAYGLLQSMALKAERYDLAEKKLAKVENESVQAELDRLFKEGDSVGKITPAMAKGAWGQGIRAKGHAGVLELKSFMLTAPVVVSRKPVIEDTDDLSAVEMTDLDVHVFKKFVGDDPIEMKKRSDLLASLKLEDIRNRKKGKG
jgi:hypothetical protein